MDVFLLFTKKNYLDRNSRLSQRRRNWTFIWAKQIRSLEKGHQIIKVLMVLPGWWTFTCSLVAEKKKKEIFISRGKLDKFWYAEHSFCRRFAIYARATKQNNTWPLDFREIFIFSLVLLLNGSLWQKKSPANQIFIPRTYLRR